MENIRISERSGRNQADCERLRPRVEIFTGFRLERKYIDRRYYCAFCNSPEPFKSFQKWQLHSFIHVCQYCLFCFNDMGLHIFECSRRQEFLDAQQVGGQAQIVNAPLLPDNMDSGQFRLEQAVHFGTMVHYGYTFGSFVATFEEAVTLCYADLRKILSQLISNWKGVRAELTFGVIMEKADSSEKRPVKLFSPFQIYVNDMFIVSKLKIALAFLSTSLAIYSENSSGWKLSQVRKIMIRLGQYVPIMAMGYIPTPAGVSTRYTINVDCQELCFLTSVIAVLKREKLVWNIFEKLEIELTPYEKRKLKIELTKLSNYNEVIQEIIDLKEWDLTGFLGAVALEDLARFTALNDVSFMVLSYDNGYYPVYTCEDKKLRHVDLILLKQAEEGQDLNSLATEDIKYRYHFIASTNTCALIKRPGYSRDTLCTYCLRSTQVLAEHQEQCALIHKQKIRFPQQDQWKSFQLYSKLDIAFKICFTFNCYKEKAVDLSETEQHNMPVDQDLIYSTVEANVILHSYALAVIDCKGKLIEHHYYDGKLPAEQFFTTIIEMGERFSQAVKTDALPLIVTTKVKQAYQEATHCELCGNIFTEERIKVLHHNHIDNRAEVAVLCSFCNLQLRVKSHCFLGYNNSEYENRLILQLLKPSIVSDINIVAKDSSKILLLTISKINRIIDLALFVNCNFYDAILKISNVSYRLDLPSQFSTLYGMFKDREIVNPDFATEYLLNRFYFPVEWFDSPMRLLETTFPPIEFFKNPEFDEIISCDEYNHSHYMFKVFKCKTMGDYLELCTKTKVFLMSDIAINLNRVCGENFNWYPFHFPTMSSFSFFVANQMSEEPFQYLKDLDATLLFREQLKGGINFVCNRLSDANNEDIGNYDRKKERSFITFFDSNSAFCHSELKPLPHSNFDWCTRAEIDRFEIMSLSDNSQVGYMLLCTVDLPESLHKFTDSMPFFPTKTLVDPKDLSLIQQQMYSDIQEDISCPFTKEKLLLTLKYPKKEYWIHYRLLQFFISKGAILVSIEKLLRFTQKPFLRPFATLVSNCRKEAKKNNCQFDDQVLKGMYCQAYGKCCQDTSKHRDFRISLNRATSLKHLSRDNFDSFFVISPDVACFQFTKRTVLQSSPLAAGFVILDLSKLNLYSFFYSLLEKFSSLKLLGVDTDGLFVQLPSKTKDEIWRKLGQMPEVDLSRLPQIHPAFSQKNRDIPGKFSLRLWKIKQAVFLKSKYYSLLVECPRCQRYSDGLCLFCLNLKRGKNIPRSVLLRLSHDYYLQCLRRPGIEYVETRAMETRNRRLSIVKSRKVCFYSFLNSRYLHPDLITTTAFGNVSLCQSREMDVDGVSRVEG